MSAALSRDYSNLPTHDLDIWPDGSCDALAHPVLSVDEIGTITYANPAAATAICASLVGRSFDEVFPGQRHLLAIGTQAKALLTSRLDDRFCALLGGQTAAGRMISLFPEAIDPGLIADTDDLTGLLTRSSLVEVMDRALNTRAASDAGVAVHFIDLDRFKSVNDTLGHAVGDSLLKKVAARIISATRKTDHVARLGGDEFVVFQTGICAPADATRLSARLVDLLGRTYVLDGHTVNIGASVGVVISEGTDRVRDMLRHSDLALYEAKRAGRSRYRVYGPEMNVALSDRRELEIELRRALALRQFELHYQPYLDLQTDKIIGFEALIRWNHPTRGRVSPADFIPIAEETGLITKIGEWVLRSACEAAVRWEDDLCVSVNVSPVQFRAENLVEVVVSTLAHSGLPPHRLEIEITEGALLDNTEAVLKTLASLRGLGVKISMDDFGTGYSSLSYLQKFPFDKIKIDRSFVQAASAGGEGEAILKAISGLGTSLGMAITAEGVETEEQLERMRLERCTHVQGFLTGRPMSAADVGVLLKKGS